VFDTGDIIGGVVVTGDKLIAGVMELMKILNTGDRIE
jgi:hypothetical protein